MIVVFVLFLFCCRPPSGNPIIYSLVIPYGPPSPAHHPRVPSLDSLDDKGQQALQKDQPQRGVALGPPGHPQGGRLASPATQEEERLSRLEQRLEQMAVMLDMVKAQVFHATGVYRQMLDVDLLSNLSGFGDDDAKMLLLIRSEEHTSDSSH